MAGVFFAGKIAEQFLQEKRQACGRNGQPVVGMGPGQGNASLHGVKACSVPVFFFVIKPFRGAGRNEVARVSIGVLMKKIAIQGEDAPGARKTHAEPYFFRQPRLHAGTRFRHGGIPVDAHE